MKSWGIAGYNYYNFNTITNTNTVSDIGINNTAVLLLLTVCTSLASRESSTFCDKQQQQHQRQGRRNLKVCKFVVHTRTRY